MLAASKKNTAEGGADLAVRRTSTSRIRERSSSSSSRTTPTVGKSSKLQLTQMQAKIEGGGGIAKYLPVS